MNWSHLPLDPAPRVLRQFAAAWFVLCAALAAHQIAARGFSAAGAAASLVALPGLVGLWIPAAVRWLFVAATVVAFPLGWVVTQTMLAVMFFAILTPLALVFRCLGRDALRLRHPAETAGGWIERAAPPPPARYLKQF
ncbi:MAG: SxtJ family membrane protein [Verrucomicrobiota bacterium]